MADIRKLRTTLQSLRSQRSTLNGVWDEIETYVMPLTGKTFSPIPTGKTELQAWDFTAPLACEHLAAALAGAVVPSSARWFGFEFNDPELRRDQAALAYLEKLTELTWSELRNSDFAMEIGAGFLEYVGIGNMVLVVEPTSEEKWEGLDFSSVPSKQSHFVEDSRGGVAEYYRDLKWTPVQILDRCGDGPVPQRVTQAVKAGGDQAVTPLDVCFAIWEREELEKEGPRDDKGKKLPLAPERRPYGYCYFLLESGEMLGEEGGYYEMPVVVGRWAKMPGQTWGFGRGNMALLSVKYLNAYLEVARAAAEKVADPSTMVTERGLLSDLNLQPGGLTVARSKEDAWVHESGARFDVNSDVIRDCRGEIRRLFHEDDLQLKESPAMTATEVQARRDLMDRSLGAPVGRLQTDVLSPIIHLILGHLDRAGKLPPVPGAVKAKQAEVAVTYYGAISRAQRVDEVASIERLSAFVASLVKSDPEHFGAAADVFDPVVAVREAALRLGTPAMVLKSDEVVAREREAKAKLQMAMQQAELAKIQAGAARDAATAAATMPAAQPPTNLLGGAGMTIQPQPSLMPQTGFPPGA